MDEWTRQHHEAYKAPSEEERRRMELIARSKELPSEGLPPGWREPDPEHPGLVGEARARMEAQRRKKLLELLRSEPSRAEY